MSLILQYVLVVCGAVYLISCARIMTPFRVVIGKASNFFGYLVYCTVCTSFWVGVALYLAGAYPFEPVVKLASDGFGALFGGAVESGVVAMGIVSVWSTNTQYVAPEIMDGKYNGERSGHGADGNAAGSGGSGDDTASTKDGGGSSG